MFFALMVFLCGGLGAMTRFFLDKAMSPRLRTESSIISPVFVINLVGSFLYGLLIMPVSNPRALGVHYNATEQVAFTVSPRVSHRAVFYTGGEQYAAGMNGNPLYTTGNIC